MSEKSSTETFTQRTVDLALTNVEEGGKPFACVVVDRETGEVVHEATDHRDPRTCRCRTQRPHGLRRLRHRLPVPDVPGRALLRGSRTGLLRGQP